MAALVMAPRRYKIIYFNFRVRLWINLNFSILYAMWWHGVVEICKFIQHSYYIHISICMYQNNSIYVVKACLIIFVCLTLHNIKFQTGKFRKINIKWEIVSINVFTVCVCKRCIKGVFESTKRRKIWFYLEDIVMVVPTYCMVKE